MEFVKNEFLNGYTIDVYEEKTPECIIRTKKIENNQIYKETKAKNGDYELQVGVKVSNGVNKIMDSKFDFYINAPEIFIGEKTNISQYYKLKTYERQILLVAEEITKKGVKVIGTKIEKRFENLKDGKTRKIDIKKMKTEEFDYKIIDVYENENYSKHIINMHSRKENYNEIHKYVVYEDGTEEYKCFKSGFLKELAVKNEDGYILQDIMDKQVIREMKFDVNGFYIQPQTPRTRKLKNRRENMQKQSVSKDCIRLCYEHFLPKYKEYDNNVIKLIAEENNF